MLARRKASDAELLAAYEREGNVHKVGALFGMRGSSAHERLVKLGAINSNGFTQAEREELALKYDVYANAGRLADLAVKIGRPKTSLARVARSMGLTDQRRKKRYHAKWKYMSEDDARVIMDHFKRSRLGLGQYCGKYGYDDLGFSRTLRDYFPDEWEHVIEAKVPRQTMYRLGRGFEYRTRDYLRDLDYIVTRSPASRSPVDLIAIGPNCVLFVQCKRGSNLPVKEWNELFALADCACAVPVLAGAGRGGRGIDFYELLDFKDGSKRRQPMRPLEIGRAGEGPKRSQTVVLPERLLEPLDAWARQHGIARATAVAEAVGAYIGAESASSASTSRRCAGRSPVRCAAPWRPARSGSGSTA